MFHINGLCKSCYELANSTLSTRLKILVQCFVREVPTKFEKKLLPEKVVPLTKVIFQLTFDCNSISFTTVSVLLLCYRFSNLQDSVCEDFALNLPHVR